MVGALLCIEGVRLEVMVFRCMDEVILFIRACAFRACVYFDVYVSYTGEFT